MEMSVFTIESGEFEDNQVEYIIIGPPMNIDAVFDEWCKDNPYKLKYVDAFGMDMDTPVSNWDTVKGFVKFLIEQGYIVTDDWGRLYFRKIYTNEHFDDYGVPRRMFK